MGSRMTTTSEPIYAPQGISAPISGGVGAMALSALGVVFGDIGTSPLYTLKTVLARISHQHCDRGVGLDALPLRAARTV